ncbi:hypothetical protein OCI51_26530 (plasmid) [Lysinibacillus capsici]|uniref:phage tail protein n=1 Tax=Lysinibacillus capsici TaxID=2115968 RepID=UPI0021D9BBB6|nr:hypothetical protein [Lysinibacillus capsici]UYB50165.1 hypothetical protein OCI51_26905 [Lysinibacillus capsici]UYB50242.1 hypothetical protein OCI51_26530 [Lysinibacillus capsici]
MPVERFKAEVDADIQRFKRKMAEVDRQMHELATGVSVEINASINEFMQKVQQVQAQLQKLDATEATVEIEAILNDFMQDILQAKALAQDLDGESIKIKVSLDMDVFYTQILMVQAELAALGNQSVEVDVDLNTHTGGALSDLTTVEALLAAIRDVTINIRADISNFMAGAAIVNHQANKLDRKNIIIKIWADYTNAMESYATTVRAFAEAGQQMIGGALLSLVPALSQFLSVLVGLIGSLGVMIGVLAGQLLIMASALGIAALGFVGLAAVAIPTIKDLFDETAKLNAEQQRAKASWDAFKDTYDDIVKATEKPILQGFTSAMQGAQKILKSLSPMIESVAQSAAKMMQAFDKSINSQPIQKIFDMFNKYGSSIFENVVAGIGHLIAGLGSLIAALAPAAEAWSKNFNGMMQSFASWADGLSKSESFKTFIDYVQKYMPVISSIFADLTMGIIAFFSAFADMGGSFMTSLAGMMESFRAWAETLGENQQFQQFLNFIQESTPAVLTLLGNLWDLIINLGIAFAPVGAIVLEVANAFLEWFNRMLEAEGIFSSFIGVLPVIIGLITAFVPIVISVASVLGNLTLILPLVKKAFEGLKTALSVVWSVLKLGKDAFGAVQAALLAFSSPVAIAIAAVGLLIAAFVLAYNKVDWFRDLVNEAWEFIKTNTQKAFKAVSEAITKAIEEAVKFAQEILDKFREFWDEHGKAITKIVKTTFQFIAGLIEAKMTVILAVIEAAWDLITGVISIAWDLIKGIIKIGLDLILGIIDVGLSLLQGDWEGAWDTIKETAQSIWDTIVETFSSIIDKVLKIGGDIIDGLAKGIIGGYNKVKEAAENLASKLPEWVKKVLGIHSPSRVMASVAKWIPAGVAKGITDNINVAKSASQEMANAIVPDFSESVKASQGLLKQINDISKKYAKEHAATRYDEFEKLLSDQKKWYNISANYEKAYWEDVAKLLKDGTAAKRRALENAQGAYQQVLKEQYYREIKFIDEATKYNAISLTDRIQAYEQYMKQYALGSEQQIAYEEKIYDAKKELYDRMKSLSDDYLSKVQTVYDNLANEEKRLRDEWQQTYDARVETLKNTWGLFDKVSLTDMTDVDLLGNLRGQVDTMRGWMNDLFELEARGLDAALIGELQQMGAKSAAEIAALTRMTASELNEYQMLWQTKTELAKKQATKELESARVAMEEEVEKLNTNSEEELKKLQKTFESEVKKLRYGAEDEFNLMSKSLPDIGANAIQGLIKGLNSMKGKLQSTAKSIADSLKNTLQTTLDLDGVNTVTKNAGAALTSSLQKSAIQTAFAGNNFTSDTSRYINQNLVQDIDYEQQPLNVYLTQEWTGEEVGTYLDDRSSTNIQIKTFKKG